MLVAVAIICATAKFGVSLPLSPELREGIVWAATEFLLWPLFQVHLKLCCVRSLSL
jgi:hypothetical protein